MTSKSGGTDFVEDWTIVSTLGEGAFGEVKLLVNKTKGDAVAMKTIDLKKHPNAEESVKKEIVIHRMLKHPHVIRYFGQRKENTKVYIFLEYAAGGELFDRIDPDVGMAECKAQKYMHHLINGVKYLHSRGITHRDLKPENLLLDVNDCVKITDFGMATMFMLDGRERMLDTRCGTLPYVAPEVLKGNYRAQPADVWSCGIILLAMLTGELPWDKPTIDCEEYSSYLQSNNYSKTPWCKLSTKALALVYSILNSDPKLRATLDQISSSKWMTQIIINTENNNNSVDRKRKISESQLTEVDGSSTDSSSTTRGIENLTKRINQMQTAKKNLKMMMMEDDESAIVDEEDALLPRACQSQPEPIGRWWDERNDQNHDCADKENNMRHIDKEVFCFSQPTDFDSLLLTSQLQFTHSPNQNNFHKFVKRMTRFFVHTTFDTTMKRLGEEFDKQACKWVITSAGFITITTTDRRNMPLVFKAHVLDMDGKVLVDFRLSKGCGLDFKRRFIRIKQHIDSIIIHGSIPDYWPVAIFNNNRTTKVS